MTDHQIILTGVWAVTGIMWLSRVVAGWACIVMTVIAFIVSYS